MGPRMRLKPVTEEFIRRMAWIMGEFSAAQKAINDYEQRKKSEPYQVGFYIADDNTIVVGPMIPGKYT